MSTDNLIIFYPIQIFYDFVLMT